MEQNQNDRKVGREGIVFNGSRYNHPELRSLEGKNVQVSLNNGMLEVFSMGEKICTAFRSNLWNLQQHGI